MQTIQWQGKPIGFPGIYHGVDIDFYHSAKACIEPSISSSGLRSIFGDSPKHYWAQSPYNPKAKHKPPTAALKLGQATHHLLLGEKRFKERFIVRPDVLGGVKWHGSRPGCKAWLKKHEHLTIITGQDAEAVIGMSRSLAQEPLVQAGILNGKIETSFMWKDEETGIWLKARPDACPTESMDFADLKTTTDVHDEDLQNTIFNFGYWQQAALIAEGCYKLTKQKMNSFSLIFVESKEPYCTSIVTLKENDIERGHQANRMALRKFAECLKSGNWYGPNGGRKDAAYIEMKPWHQKQIDEKLAAGI